MNFATQQANIATNAVRRDTLDGREYVVAPVVAVREMVLKGELLQLSEIEASAPAFNGRPLPVGHPKDDNGEFVSANDRDLWENGVVGWFFEAHVEDSALKGEVWVDIDKSNALASNVDESLGQPLAWLANHLDDESANAIDVAANAPDDDSVLEVSTAYWYIPQPENGVFEGNEYSATQHALKPDHLALLPNSEGECSAEDGCGVRVESNGSANATGANDSTPPVAATGGSAGFAVHANEAPRTPEFDGVETDPAWGDVDLSFDAFVDAFGDGTDDVGGVEDLPESVAEDIAARSLNGNADATDFETLSTLPVVNPETGRLSESGLRAALSAAPETDGIDVDATQELTRHLLESHFNVDLEAEASREAATNATDHESFIDRFRSRLASYGIGTGSTCGGTCDDDNTDETMNYETLSESTGVSVNILKAMSDDERESLRALAEETTGDGGDDDDDPNGNDGGADDSVAEQVQALRDELREEIAEVKATVSAQEQAERDDAVNTIKENTDIPEDELEGMSTDALASFANEVAPQQGADYAAFGATRSRDAANPDADAGNLSGMSARLSGVDDVTEADD